MRKHLFVCLSLLASTGCGGSTESPEPLPEETARSRAPLVGQLEVVAGDSTCAPGTYLMPVSVARANLKPVCYRLAPGDFVRLGGGGAMGGTAYNCAIYDVTDSKRLGSLCMPPPVPWFEQKGDGSCPQGSELMSPQEARNGGLDLCNSIGRWDHVRLSGGGSITGKGYSTYCTIQDQDPAVMGWSLCKPTQLAFERKAGDWPCAPWQGLVSPNDARQRLGEICPLLGTSDIARLSGGGSVQRDRYGNTCVVSDWDTRDASRSVCQSMY
ncbi:hypothetical protein [Pyxidicoccus sp. MSG2]|uniref:hypothetical protein n=1 Tax=Pyxidicoccus sp. MSG2 TaxID=2996790 RepID=UPI00226D7716|nr:hypothetical protein [Pyxidicoccus sp. MSG2]MCY1019940.1 hypothetical protein [Pyxidicoccus sp. MSG2]